MFAILAKQYSLINQPNISYAATEPAEYPAGPVLPFFIGFSILTLIFADCKPLDFIDFTGTLFLKTAPTIDFIASAGTFLSVR